MTKENENTMTPEAQELVILMLDDRLTRARLALRAVVYSDTLDRAQEEAFQGLKNSELTNEKKAVR